MPTKYMTIEIYEDIAARLNALAETGATGIHCLAVVPVANRDSTMLVIGYEPHKPAPTDNPPTEAIFLDPSDFR